MGHGVMKPDFRLNTSHCPADINVSVPPSCWWLLHAIITPEDNISRSFLNSLAKALSLNPTQYRTMFDSEIWKSVIERKKNASPVRLLPVDHRILEWLVSVQVLCFYYSRKKGPVKIFVEANLKRQLFVWHRKVNLQNCLIIYLTHPIFKHFKWKQVWECKIYISTKD